MKMLLFFQIIRSCEQLKGADVYLANRAQNPPIYGAKRIPKKLHYSGEWTPDILIVAHPGTNHLQPKILLNYKKITLLYL
jgi:hypothetical protein